MCSLGRKAMKPTLNVSSFSVKVLLTLLSLNLLAPSLAFSADGGPVEVSPSWLKVGTYVEYDVSVNLFTTYGHATLRWECMSLEDNIATLHLSHTASGSQPYVTPISPKSTIIRVLTDTREVIDPNGTVVGKIYLWLPPFMKKGQQIVLEGNPPNETIGTVYWEGGSCVKTCQGYQEVTCFERTKNNKDLFHDVIYDIDTGIMLLSPLPLLVVESLGVQEYFSDVYTIIDTNVNLGPQYLRAAILHGLWDNLPIILLITITITTILLVRRKRKQKPR